METHNPVLSLTQPFFIVIPSNQLQQEIAAICRTVEDFRLEQYAGYSRARRLLWVPVGIGFVSLCLLLAKTVPESFAPVGVILLIGSVVAWFYLYFAVLRKYRATYRKEFKKRVLTAFVSAAYPNLQYRPECPFTVKDFEACRLFPKPEKFDGEDYFEGTIGERQLRLQVAEVHARHVKRYEREKGRKKEVTSLNTVFRGLFFVVSNPQPIQGGVMLMPDDQEASMSKYQLEGISKWVQGTLAKWTNKAMVYFDEYPEFEKQFVVYADSEREALNLLTENWIRAASELRNRWNNKVHISFVGDKIYVCLPMRRNMFEVPLHKSLLEPGTLDAVYQEMLLCFQAIEGFALAR